MRSSSAARSRSDSDSSQVPSSVAATRLASRNRGFTLVEVIVVAAVAGVIASLMLPSVQSARGSARLNQCRNSMLRWGLALHNYHDVHNALPQGWIGVAEGKSNPNGGNGFGWSTFLLPYIEQAEIYNRIDFKLDLNRQPDPGVFAESLGQLVNCPADESPELFQIQDDLIVGSSNYAALFGTEPIVGCYRQPQTNEPGQPKIVAGKCSSNGLFSHNSNIKFGDVTDGLSNTMMVGERTKTTATGEHWGTWAGASPGIDFSAFQVLIDTFVTDLESRPGFALGSHHQSFNVTFGDGSVRSLSPSIDPQVLHAVSTRNGGEIVGEF